MMSSHVRGKALDQLMFRHAATATGHDASDAAFEAGYAVGRFHFSTDPALLGELIALHRLNLHVIAGEWLAFRDHRAVFGQTPSEAVCGWVVQHA